MPYYIPLVVGDDVLDWLEAGILGGSGSNGTFIVKGPLEHFPWDGKHKNDGHFAIEADMTGGRLDFLPSHVRKADGSWETASSWPVLNNIDAPSSETASKSAAGAQPRTTSRQATSSSA